MTNFGVTRSMEISATEAARKRIARPNGWWGILIFIATEATLFAMIFGAYYYTRFQNKVWPPPGIPPPHIATPLILAGVLAVMSVPLQISYWSARAGRVALACWLLTLALIVQLGFFAMQIHSLQDDLKKFTPSGSAYGSVYYFMLGAHEAHVAVGILLSAFLVYRLLKGLTNYRLIGLQSTVFYWHFVNFLTLCVVATQLSAA